MGYVGLMPHPDRRIAGRKGKKILAFPGKIPHHRGLFSAQTTGSLAAAGLTGKLACPLQPDGRSLRAYHTQGPRKQGRKLREAAVGTSMKPKPLGRYPNLQARRRRTSGLYRGIGEGIS